MVKKIILAVSLLLVCVSLGAQVTGGIRGTVVSRVDRKPVPGAELTLYVGSDLVAETVSGKDGTFLFEELPDGIYNLMITRTSSWKRMST